MSPRVALAVALVGLAGAVGATGCNQLFGLDVPLAGGDDDGGGGPDGPSVDANPDDLDGDGVRNGVDNCAGVYNPSQADEDSDAEINGGDACDPCPHLGAGMSGSPHPDADQDGVGDECDPSLLVRHCIRWFDGFSDTPDVALARYRTSGGRWTVSGGHLVQSDGAEIAAEAVIANSTFAASIVSTAGRMDALPTTGGNSGAEPYRNALGVIGGRAAGGANTCFGTVSRSIASGGMAGPASAVLSHRAQLTEIVDAELSFPPGTVALNPGERFGVTLDLIGTPAAPRVIGSLFDRGVLNHVVSAVQTCEPSLAGARTSFASVSFEYLLVIDAGDADACAPRAPLY